MAPPKSIGELWFTADGLLSISAISYTKWYDKSCLQTMSCCSILWLSRAVPGQMLWWKVCQYRTTAVYTGVLKSQRERVACLRMRIKVPIVLVSSYDVQQKWSKAWEKVLSYIQSVGKKERLCRTEWHSGKNKIHLICCFFPTSESLKTEWWKGNGGRVAVLLQQMGHIMSVQSSLIPSPPWLTSAYLWRGAEFGKQNSHRVISCFVNLVGSV